MVQLRSTDSPNLVDFADILEICVGCSDCHHFPSNLGGIVKKLYEKKQVSSLFDIIYLKIPFRGLYGCDMVLNDINGARIVQIWRKDPEKEKNS